LRSLAAKLISEFRVAGQKGSADPNRNDRNNRDFSKQDREELRYAELCLEPITRMIEERQVLENAWTEL